MCKDAFCEGNYREVSLEGDMRLEAGFNFSTIQISSYYDYEWETFIIIVVEEWNFSEQLLQMNFILVTKLLTEFNSVQ